MLQSVYTIPVSGGSNKVGVSIFTKKYMKNYGKCILL